MAVTRVLLVDDESMVRGILKQILRTYPDMELVGEAATGYEAVAAVERLQPDIVIMDIRVPGLDGIAAAREIRDRYPQVKVIGLSEMHMDITPMRWKKPELLVSAKNRWRWSNFIRRLRNSRLLIQQFSHKLRQAPQPSQPSCFSGSVAGPWRRDGYPLYSVLPLDFAHEVITSESSDHKKGNDLSRSVLLVGHHSI